jgi:hypothetical protein
MKPALGNAQKVLTVRSNTGHQADGYAAAYALIRCCDTKSLFDMKLFPSLFEEEPPGSAFEVLEPYAGKLARTVLRGAGGP